MTAESWSFRLAWVHFAFATNILGFMTTDLETGSTFQRGISNPLFLQTGIKDMAPAWLTEQDENNYMQTF